MVPLVEPAKSLYQLLIRIERFGLLMAVAAATVPTLLTYRAAVAVALVLGEQVALVLMLAVPVLHHLMLVERGPTNTRLAVTLRFL
jgi:hypothetical protein